MNDSTLEIIKTTTSCLALIGIVIAIFQIRLNRKSLSLNSFKSIYDESLKIRKKFEDAKSQRNGIVSTLRNYDPTKYDINNIYSQDEYADLREIGYYYEYVAILVKKGLIPIDLVFELIVFPDTFWHESAEFMKLMRKHHYKDFWSNFESLKSVYEKERSKKNRS